MIPKKIHYCWFGRGQKPALAEKCIESWKKYCPDYEIIEWNEDNFDVSKYPLAEYCLKNKKYAFLSDYVRLIVVDEFGGFYFDTDVELVGNIDNLCEYEAVYGFETDDAVNTGQGFGAQAHHITVSAMRQIYAELAMNQEGEFPFITCPHYNTKALLALGLELGGKKQTIHNALILPVDYMNPLDNATGIIKKTENTLSIHWYSKSWISKKQRIISKITRPFHRIFGDNCFAWLKRKK